MTKKKKNWNKFEIYWTTPKCKYQVIIIKNLLKKRLKSVHTFFLNFVVKLNSGQNSKDV